MPCIRCGKITVKLCTCSIEEARVAFSSWSEVELEQAISTLRTVLNSRQSVPEGATRRTETMRKSPNGRPALQTPRLDFLPGGANGRLEHPGRKTGA